jgi:Fe-S-cluster containining protein
VSDDAALAEHRAALAKIDAAVAHAAALAGDALTCHRGCASCCVDGLTVLPVEAALIREHLFVASSSPFARARVSRDGACAFLDSQGACSVYEARPVLCRTHGLALQMRAS